MEFKEKKLETVEKKEDSKTPWANVVSRLITATALAVIAGFTSWYLVERSNHEKLVSQAQIRAITILAEKGCRPFFPNP